LQHFPLVPALLLVLPYSWYIPVLFLLYFFIFLFSAAYFAYSCLIPGVFLPYSCHIFGFWFSAACSVYS